MFGPDMLVAPILFEGQRARDVYLPRERVGSAMGVERPLKVARSSTKLPRSSTCRSFFARKDLCAFKADFQLSTPNEGRARGLELFSLEMLESAEASGEHTRPRVWCSASA